MPSYRELDPHKQAGIIRAANFFTRDGYRMNAPSWIGRTLGGRYQIEQLLGQGGMSAVYKANDPNLKRIVAVKLIHSHLSTDPRFVHRFEEEATAVAQLRHPNIVQVFDFNQDDGVYYMVMEFIPGETLQDRLRRYNRSKRFISLSKVVQYAIDICSAVGYAHKRGLIHRDIKPANIMLDVHDQAILMDFGIVKIVGAETFTATGAVVGTALYLPPEIIRGETPDPRSDLYSLGVTLYEMVSGKPPFEAESAMTLMMMHLHDPVPDLSQLRPDAPPQLSAIIERALAKDRSERFASAEEMIQALKAIQPLIASLEPGGAVTSVAQTAPKPTPASSATKTPQNQIATEAEGIVETPTTTDPIRPAVPVNPPHSEPPSAESVHLEPAHLEPDLQTIIPTDVLPSSSEPQKVIPPAVSVPPQPAQDSSTQATLLSPISRAANFLRRPVWLAAALALVVLLAIGGILVFNNFSAGRAGSGALTAEAMGIAPSATSPAPAAMLEATSTATATVTPLPTLTSTSTSAQVYPPTETPSPSSTPTSSATPTPDLFVLIKSITIDNNRYVVDYETFGYTEKLPGMHVHFFFDTVTQENAGVPGYGPWILYGGPRPFSGYKLNDRPAQAKQMCALVANADHSIIPNSGTCLDLP